MVSQSARDEAVNVKIFVQHRFALMSKHTSSLLVKPLLPTDDHQANAQTLHKR